MQRGRAGCSMLRSHKFMYVFIKCETVVGFLLSQELYSYIRRFLLLPRLARESNLEAKIEIKSGQNLHEKQKTGDRLVLGDKFQFQKES